jgi:hypothetical protein
VRQDGNVAVGLVDSSAGESKLLADNASSREQQQVVRTTAEQQETVVVGTKGRTRVPEMDGRPPTNTG